MGNFFNKKQRVASLLDDASLAMMYNEPTRGYSNNKPKTNVVINTNRLWYSDNSTVSEFLATAYDEQGNKVDSMRGFFLEPQTDYEEATVAGKDKAILYGNYNIIPKQYNWQHYKWYVDKVPGRTGIAIHGGVSGDNTEGCLIPGEDFYFDKKANEYKIKGSKNKKEELFKFFNNYGQNGIKITVGI